MEEETNFSMVLVPSFEASGINLYNLLQNDTIDLEIALEAISQILQTGNSTQIDKRDFDCACYYVLDAIIKEDNIEKRINLVAQRLEESVHSFQEENCIYSKHSDIYHLYGHVFQIMRSYAQQEPLLSIYEGIDDTLEMFNNFDKKIKILAYITDLKEDFLKIQIVSKQWSKAIKQMDLAALKRCLTTIPDLPIEGFEQFASNPLAVFPYSEVLDQISIIQQRYP